MILNFARLFRQNLILKTATTGLFWVNIRSLVLPVNNTSGLGFSLETLSLLKIIRINTYIPYLAWENVQLLKSPSIKLKTSHLSVIVKSRCFDEPQDSSSMGEVLNKFISDPRMYKGSSLLTRESDTECSSLSACPSWSCPWLLL